MKKRHTFDLAALKAKGLRHCTYDDLVPAIVKIEPTEGTAADEAAQALAAARVAIDKQFAPFVPPQDECIGCGAILVGKNMIDAFLRATFTYGLTHGEGYCRQCGYPARANHYAPENEPGLSMLCVLQYHPDGLEERKPAAVSP